MKHGTMAGVLALSFFIGVVLVQPASTQMQSTSDMGSVPSGELALGSVRIARNVMADGKPLKAGTYRLRLTSENATPVPAGQTPQLERWVEFLQGGKVVGREVVSIVPRNEITEVAQDKPPAMGGSRVDLLKGEDYVRIWINRGGNHYLIHLPTATT